MQQVYQLSEQLSHTAGDLALRTLCHTQLSRAEPSATQKGLNSMGWGRTCPCSPATPLRPPVPLSTAIISIAHPIPPTADCHLPHHIDFHHGFGEHADICLQATAHPISSTHFCARRGWARSDNATYATPLMRSFTRTPVPWGTGNRRSVHAESLHRRCHGHGGKGAGERRKDMCGRGRRARVKRRKKGSEKVGALQKQRCPARRAEPAPNDKAGP